MYYLLEPFRTGQLKAYIIGVYEQYLMPLNEQLMKLILLEFKYT
ncbi:hypothetical protein SAMN02746098_01517 [Desulfosporosinus lacus DSM 15449]|uniref:Uncharacterized protein n=1 Tax=Desulfosporosinus lacus DSM 15449 TaxID=1121420 RepID=A0A1M5W9Y0_9FIRM|nr:hypothetical protein SAMN02746098_01517 [Desulfosporosinus lacus DSM 15449]